MFNLEKSSSATINIEMFAVNVLEGLYFTKTSLFYSIYVCLYTYAANKYLFKVNFRNTSEKVYNMFKVKNNHPRTKSMTSL